MQDGDGAGVEGHPLDIHQCRKYNGSHRPAGHAGGHREELKATVLARHHDEFSLSSGSKRN